MYNNPLAFQAHALEQRTKSGARWFFWIAGLSIITSLVTFGGGSFAFFLSLGSTQVIDGFARGLANDLGEGTKIVALVFDVLIAGVFALVGWFALKRHLWSFIVGMALFALDALILLAFQVWISFAFHALVIYWIFGGYSAARKLTALEKEMRAMPPPPPPDLSAAVPAIDSAPAG
jgi:hypothetical protein